MIDERFKTANVSELFLKPLLNIESNKLQELNYKNTYLFNAMDGERFKCDVIYLLFETEDLPIDIFITEQEQKGTVILEKHSFDNLKLLCFLLPLNFKEDYEKIIEGKYSKVSHEFKKLFPKFANKEVRSLQHMVFNKDKYLRKYWEQELDTVFTPEMEYWKLYDINKETFKYEK